MGALPTSSKGDDVKMENQMSLGNTRYDRFAERGLLAFDGLSQFRRGPA